MVAEVVGGRRAPRVRAQRPRGHRIDRHRPDAHRRAPLLADAREARTAICSTRSGSSGAWSPNAAALRTLAAATVDGAAALALPDAPARARPRVGPRGPRGPRRGLRPRAARGGARRGERPLGSSPRARWALADGTVAVAAGFPTTTPPRRSRPGPRAWRTRRRSRACGRWSCPGRLWPRRRSRGRWRSRASRARRGSARPDPAGRWPRRG